MSCYSQVFNIQRLVTSLSDTASKNQTFETLHDNVPAHKSKLTLAIPYTADT